MIPTETFTVQRKEFEPAYLKLFRSGALAKRVQQSVSELAKCLLCPRECGIDRLRDQTAVCKSGRYARVASCHPHRGEEDCLRGWRGSGTIFFSGCNLRCVFCQNFDISQNPTVGQEMTPAELAMMMLHLQDLGCHNINFVTPEHIVPQIIEALLPAVEQGLRLPLVYNTSAYDALSSLKLLDGIVDIYMPDFKMWDSGYALRYLRARDYPRMAREALKEMHRQVGVLKVDEKGLALRGVLVRHLAMPGEIAGTGDIMKFLADELSPNTYVNLMDQYYPAGKVSSQKYSEINRPLRSREMRSASKQRTMRASGASTIAVRAYRSSA